jgi:hypothetical protein
MLRRLRLICRERGGEGLEQMYVEVFMYSRSMCLPRDE